MVPQTSRLVAIHLCRLETPTDVIASMSIITCFANSDKRPSFQPVCMVFTNQPKTELLTRYPPLQIPGNGLTSLLPHQSSPASQNRTDDPTSNSICKHVVHRPAEIRAANSISAIAQFRNRPDSSLTRPSSSASPEIGQTVQSRTQLAKMLSTDQSTDCQPYPK
jgi:hypothetical protein